MIKHLFEELNTKAQGIVNGFLFARTAKREATLTYDRCKDILVDTLGGDVRVILSPESYLEVTTAVKDTIEWRTAFLELARIMAADDDEQKQALKGATNTVTSTAVQVFEPKPPGKKRKGVV